MHTIHVCVYLDLWPAEHKIKFISIGDSAILPCAINVSNNVYPVPHSVEWRKDGRQFQYEVR